MGACVFLGGNLVSLISKKKAKVSQSSEEAEYCVIAHTTSEVRWFCLILCNLGICILGSPTIKCDNQSAPFLTSILITKVKWRHLEMDFHFVLELLQQGTLRLQNVNMDDQTTNILTKRLPVAKFKRCSNLMNIGSFILF